MSGSRVLDPTMKRNDVSVKLDKEAARRAKKAASLKEVTLAEYLSDVVMAAANRDLKAEYKKGIGGAE